MPRAVRGRPVWLAFVLGLLLGLVGLSALAEVGTSGVLRLQDPGRPVDAWPAVQVARDPSGAAGWRDLEARAEGAFVAWDGPAGNLGSTADAVWLRVPVRNQSTQPRWVLDIDYPMLQRIDVHVVRDGVEVTHHQLGAHRRFEDRPLPTRSHAVALDLPPGVTHHVYVRVQTATALVVPLRFVGPERLLADAVDDQLLHGLLIGLSVALGVFSLFNAVALRDVLFLQYAVMIGSVTVFLSVFFGIGQQYLWPDPSPRVDRIAPMAMLVMMAAAAPFMANVLQMRDSHPRLNAVMQALSGTAIATFVLSLLGLIDYRATQFVSSTLGPVPLILAVPVAASRWRLGDRATRWLVLGWGIYLFGALMLMGLLRGLIPAGFWTLHAFQFATTLEMIVWMRVLGLRVQLVRRAAERAELERSTLVAMAETDALTQLPNRRGLQARLRRLLEARAADGHVAVFMLDLDGFKPVNDRLGHEAGDDLLVQVAGRLRAAVRADDMVARLGGDEFVVVSSGLRCDTDAGAVGRKLEAVFAAPYVVRGELWRLGASLGCAVAPRDGADPVALLRQADDAMYAAKRAGGGRAVRGGPAASGFAPADLGTSRL